MGIRDGKIQIGHILLDKDVSFDKFKEMHNEYIVQERKGGEGYVNILIAPQKVKNVFCILRIYFYLSKLQMVTINVRESEGFNNWEEFSIDKLIKEKKRLDKMLLLNLGIPPYKYKWGEIGTSCDVRGGASSIVINYY